MSLHEGNREFFCDLASDRFKICGRPKEQAWRLRVSYAGGQATTAIARVHAATSEAQVIGDQFDVMHRLNRVLAAYENHAPRRVNQKLVASEMGSNLDHEEHVSNPSHAESNGGNPHDEQWVLVVDCRRNREAHEKRTYNGGPCNQFQPTQDPWREHPKDAVFPLCGKDGSGLIVGATRFWNVMNDAAVACGLRFVRRFGVDDLLPCARSEP